MREFLFRGKKTGTNEWIYGSLISICGKSYIEEQVRLSKSYDVDSDTVGQYTGLKDKNGVKIFESDICVNSDKDNYPRPLSVEWIEEFACFAFVDKGDFNNMYFYQKNHMENVAVIGNIHDNKELLK